MPQMSRKEHKEHIPECRSMNFSIYTGMLDRYKDSEDIRQFLSRCGLNGLEVILCGESDQGKIQYDKIGRAHV